MSLRVEVGEQHTAELWASFGGWRCSVERARARRSELATATPLRPSFLCGRGEREGMDVSRRSRASPWRSCTRPALMSGARDGVRTPNVADVCRRAATSTRTMSIQSLRCLSDKATLALINFQTKTN